MSQKKRLLRRLVRSIIVLSCGYIAACGGGDDSVNPDNNGSTPDPPQISSVSPDPMVEGQSAVLTGTNFSANLAEITVTMDGAGLLVTAASVTSLTVTIPEGCGPLRSASLQVTVGGTASSAFSTMVAPNPTGDLIQDVELAVGEQVVFRQARHCFGLPTNGGAAQYLIGIQSTGRMGTVTRDVMIQGTITGATSVPSVPVAAVQASPRASGGFNPLPSGFGDSPGARLLQRHRAAHHAVMDDLVRPVRDPAVRLGALSAQPAPSRTVVDGTEIVGDTLELRFRKPGSSDCALVNTVTVTAVLMATSARSMWWVDVDNPQPGFSNIDLEGLATFFDEVIWIGHNAEFGFVHDIDGNGRVVILITEKINADESPEGQLLGFVNPCDLFQRDDATGLVASNEGEFFYSIAPDPAGVVGDTVSVGDLLEILPIIIAHEFTHIIQFGRREASNAPFMSSFVAEGQATLAEEVVGHLVLQHDTGQNLDLVVAFDADSTQVYPWYIAPFIDLVYYFGWPGDRDDPRIDGAPQECTWIDVVDHPCGGRPLWYGVTWSFLRWASDVYGDALGGEPAFQQALIDGNLTGFDNLEEALAVAGQGTLEDHLARWAAMLYMDNRPGASTENSMSSWDLLSINEGLVDVAWLNPQVRGFINFTETVTVRDPSTAYFLVGGSGASSTYTLRVGTPSGSDLGSDVQVWLVRTQ